MLTYDRRLMDITVEVSADQQGVHVSYRVLQKVVETDTGRQFGEQTMDGGVADAAEDPIVLAAIALTQAVVDREIATNPDGSIAARRAAAQVAAQTPAAPQPPSS